MTSPIYSLNLSISTRMFVLKILRLRGTVNRSCSGFSSYPRSTPIQSLAKASGNLPLEPRLFCCQRSQIRCLYVAEPSGETFFFLVVQSFVHGSNVDISFFFKKKNFPSFLQSLKASAASSPQIMAILLNFCPPQFNFPSGETPFGCNTVIIG